MRGECGSFQSTWDESDAFVQTSRRGESCHRAGFEAHPLVPALCSQRQEVIKDRSPDASAPGLDCGVHRLQFCVVVVQMLQRSHAKEKAVRPETEEGDGRIEQALDVQRVHILGRTVLVGEPQVGCQQLAHITQARIIQPDHTIHAAEL